MCRSNFSLSTKKSVKSLLHCYRSLRDTGPVTRIKKSVKSLLHCYWPLRDTGPLYMTTSRRLPFKKSVKLPLHSRGPGATVNRMPPKLSDTSLADFSNCFTTYRCLFNLTYLYRIMNVLQKQKSLDYSCIL